MVARCVWAASCREVNQRARSWFVSSRSCRKASQCSRARRWALLVSFEITRVRARPRRRIEQVFEPYQSQSLQVLERGLKAKLEARAKEGDGKVAFKTALEPKPVTVTPATPHRGGMEKLKGEQPESRPGVLASVYADCQK
ncbi:MAG: hypothetical protein M2R45_03755 [Verrucomicrobia subdivision 3 bacterium]|nr:hypothetical protein [Limisphaerales bacterium]MCS1416921.1 hypothetical protein [Limisphaerales bacterium]